MAYWIKFCRQKYKFDIVKWVMVVSITALLTRFLTSTSENNGDVVEIKQGNIDTNKHETSTKTDTLSKKTKNKNVLFIMTDDMRTQLSPYAGKLSQFKTPKMLTPNFQRLASRSLVLTNAFIQFSLCGPSRTSMLTGRRPDATRVYYNTHYWRTEAGNFTTLPQYFKEQGYTSLCFGKVFHSSSVVDGDYPRSWSRPCTTVRKTERIHRAGAKEAIWKAVPDNDLVDNPLEDTLAVQELESTLKKLAPDAKTGDKPFFVAMGFNKPHLPFICPESFVNKYPLETGKRFLSNATWQSPIVRDGCSITNTTRLDEYTSVLDEMTLRHYRQAYFGCISYVDYLLGRVLDTVDSLGLADTTIISFVADHGYHLGENGWFGKQTVLDTSTRVPMFLSIPGRTDRGTKSRAIVEALDLFPTIVEAAGRPVVPPCPRNSSTTRLCTHGSSFLSLSNGTNVRDKKAAMSQVRPDTPVMHYSIRTRHYRYSQWARVEMDDGRIVRYELTPESEQYPSELYDHQDDLEETINRSKDAKYRNIKESLKNQLLDLWETCN